MQVSTEGLHRQVTLLDLLREMAQEVAQRQLLKDQDPTKAPPKSTLGTQNSTLQVLQRLRNSKKMHISGCFGQKIDRIGSVSRLGCNGEFLPCHFTANSTPAPPPTHPYAYHH
ncbi:Natriuretic peptides B [Lemmus lemmus]